MPWGDVIKQDLAAQGRESRTWPGRELGTGSWATCHGLWSGVLAKPD